MNLSLAHFAYGVVWAISVDMGVFPAMGAIRGVAHNDVRNISDLHNCLNEVIKFLAAVLWRI